MKNCVKSKLSTQIWTTKQFFLRFIITISSLRSWLTKRSQIYDANQILRFSKIFKEEKQESILFSIQKKEEKRKKKQREKSTRVRRNEEKFN